MRRSGAILLCTALLCAGLVVAPAPARGVSLFGLKNNLVQFLLARISDPGVFEVAVARVEEPHESGTRLVGVTVSDGRGVWLSIGTVEFDWNPARLLRGQIEIGHLRLADARLSRLPDPGPSEDAPKEEGEGGGALVWPRSPLALLIRRFEATDVSIAEGVTPQAVRFDASGAVRDEGDIQSLKLALTRTDAVAGGVSIACRRDFAAPSLRLDVKGREAPGGLIAALSGLPDDVPAHVDVVAAGPDSAWRITLDMAAEKVLSLTGALEATWDGPVAVNGSFKLTPGAKMGEGQRALITPAATLRLDLREGEKRRVVVNEARIVSPHLRAEVSGAVERGGADGAVMNLAVDMRAGGALSTLIDGAGFGSTAFVGALRGPLDALIAQGKLTVEGLDTGAVSATTLVLGGEAQRIGARIAFTLDGRGEGVAIAALDGAANMAPGETVGGPPDRRPNVAHRDAADTTRDRTASGALAGASSDVLDKTPGDAPDSPANAGPVATRDGATGGASNGGADTALDRMPVEAPDETLNGQPVATPGGAGSFAPVLLSASGSVEAGAVRLAAARISTEGLSVEASGDVAADGVLDLKLSAAADPALAARIALADFEAATFDGTVRGPADALRAKGEFAVRGLESPTAAATRLTASGAVEVTGEDIRFELTGAGAGVRVGRLGPDLLGAATLAARGGVSGGRLTLEAARIAAAPGFVEASGEAPLGPSGGAADLSYRAQIADLAPLAAAYDADAGGALEASGGVSGPFDALAIEGEATLRGARYGAARLGDASLTHELALGGGSISGGAGLTMSDSEVGGGAAAAKFTLTGDALNVSSLSGDLGGVRFAGEVAADLAAGLARGGFDLSSRDLRSLGALAGTPLSGVFDGRVDLSAEDGRQGATWRAKARNLVVAGGRVADAETRGWARDLTGSPVFGATVALTDLGFGGGALPRARLTAQGPLSALRLTAHAEGTAGEAARGAAGFPVAFDAEAVLALKGRTTEITLSRLDAAAAGEAFALARPARIAVTGGTARLEDLAVALPEGGSMSGAVTLTDAGARGRVDLRAVPLRLAQVFAGVPIEAGTLGLDISFDTRRGSPSATGALTVADLRLDAARQEQGGLNVAADLGWDGKIARIGGDLRGDFGDPAKFSVRLPMIPGAGPAPRLREDGDIDATLRWAGEVEPLWALAPLPDHLLSGRAVVDVRLSGRLADPGLSGEISLNDGQYQNLASGTILTHVQVHSQVRDGREIALTLTARDGAKGKVDGELNLDMRGGGLIVGGGLRAHRAVLVRRDEAAARFDADIAFAGPPTNLRVSGDIDVLEAEVRLIAGPTSVVDLGPIRIKGAPEPEAPPEPPGRVALDLRIRTPGKIFVRGRGLDSEWGANIDVSGTAARPLIKGAVRSRRGFFDLIGRSFKLTKGEIGFAGGREIDPSLDIVFTREADDITGRVNIGGYASAPKLTFDSTPMIPEDEVLPRVVFGRASQSLTALEAVQLASGIATLTSGEASPTDAVRAALGLDSLRVDGDEGGGSTVTVGRYVREGVYVGAKQGLDGAGGAAVIELDVLDNVTLDAEMGAKSSVGASWKFDF